MLYKFGFSQYESKVYEALASTMQPMDATIIVKLSGVPKAKIYEVISRMVEKGMVLESVSEKKKLYSALPLPLVIEKLTAEFQSDVQELEQHKVQRGIIDDHVWSLKADASIGSQLKQLMENAERSIRFSAWEDDFRRYLPILLEKQNDGVKVEGVVIGDTPDGLPQIVPMKPSKQHVLLERFRLLIVDDREVVFAGVEQGSWQAIMTRSQPFVRVFTDYFHHDLLLTKITGKYSEILLNDEEIMTELLQLKY